MKFCAKCGAQVEDNNAFCLACGAPMENAEAPAPEAAADQKQQIIKIGAIAVAAIVVLAIIISLFGGGAKGAAKKWVKVEYKGKTSVKGLVPKDIWEYYDDELKVDVDDVKDAVEDAYDDQMDSWEEEYGKKVKFSYKIEGTQKLDKRDIKKINKSLEKRYDVDDDLVKAAKKIEIDVKIKGDGEYVSGDEFITVVKIKGKWYPIRFDGENAAFLLDQYARK